jgi:8-amino-7-oxononanoate synthase
MLPIKLEQKLEQRRTANALRTLSTPSNLVDFSSNDYLGFSKSKTIFKESHNFLLQHDIQENGATGSRLLSGNHKLYTVVEQQLCEFHNSPSATIFNSGYDANVGFFSTVPQRGDIILYDEFIHASIRDGITMSHAKAYKFKHNDLDDLEKRCQIERRREVSLETNIYIVTESVFSMDGDSPNLNHLNKLAQHYNALLVVDEAHAVGVFGNDGQGIIQDLNLEPIVFARIVTFGKAMGCHGAVILGSTALKTFLINFCRTFIYTTALPPHSLATIHAAYQTLKLSKSRMLLKQNITHFKAEISRNHLESAFIPSLSAIHCCIIPGNATVKLAAKKLQDLGFNVKPILSPTVPKGKERLRFCLHSYNSKEDATKVLNALSTFARI